MADRFRPVHQASLGEVLDDFGIGFLDEEPGEGLDLRPESTRKIDHMANRDAFLQRELEVVDAVSGRGVHDACPIFH